MESLRPDVDLRLDCLKIANGSLSLAQDYLDWVAPIQSVDREKEERQRIINALAAHAFKEIAEGEEARIYDVRTDSMWLVGRKDGMLAWREDPEEGEGSAL